MRNKQIRLPYQCYELSRSTADPLVIGDSVETLHSAMTSSRREVVKNGQRRAGKRSSLFTSDEGLISVPISVCSDTVSLSIGESSTNYFERTCVKGDSDLISIPVMYGWIDCIPSNKTISEGLSFSTESSTTHLYFNHVEVIPPVDPLMLPVDLPMLPVDPLMLPPRKRKCLRSDIKETIEAKRGVS